MISYMGRSLLDKSMRPKQYLYFGDTRGRARLSSWWRGAVALESSSAMEMTLHQQED